MGSRAALVTAFATIIVWSSAYSAARVGLRHFDPIVFSALRNVAAAVTLAPIALSLRVGLPARGDRWKVFGSGVVGMTVYHSLLNVGLGVVESASAALLIALSPILVALMSMQYIGERLTNWGWIGLGAAFLGVVVVSLGQGSGIRFGLSSLLVILAAAAHAAYIVMTKKLTSIYRPVQVVTWAFWSAALTFIPVLFRAVTQLSAAPAEGYFAFVYLGVGASALGFVLWARALAGAPASVVASALYVTPPLSALIGWVWLDEQPTLWVLAGGMIILSAVFLVMRKGMAPTCPGPAVSA